MLKKWILGNFKSVAEKTELDLAAITVLAGANSSGKSTVLQSILAVAQTQRATTGKYPLVLNGEFIRLGYLSDTIHNYSHDKPVVIGFELHEHGSGNVVVSEILPIHVVFKIKSEEPFSNAPYGKLDDLIIRWKNGKIALKQLSENDVSIWRFSNQLNIPLDIFEDLHNGMYGYKLNASESSQAFNYILPFYPQFNLHNFLPERQLETYDYLNFELKRLLHEIADLIQGDLGKSDASLLREIRQKSNTNNALRNRLSDELDRKKPNQSSDTQLYNIKRVAASKFSRSGSLEEGIRYLTREVPKAYHAKIAKEIKDAANAVQSRDKEAPLPEIGVRLTDFPVPLSRIIDEITQYFRKNIYYLGPLREPPQYLYILPPFPDIRYVGTKGEYTAAVLERYRGEHVDFPLPPGTFKKDQKVIENGPLQYALQVWLEYMGLIETVSTQDRGKMGTELTVRSSGVDRDLDLTSIGVGVSQVLPTLVGCLIAPKGTTFLLEQPELHLHPKVQGALADFFIGLIRTGKQMILETHSEYLINRLRRRVAEDEEDALAKDIQIYFVEREHGKSTFRPVNLTEYGATIDWPKGFFDEGPAEAQLILDAAMQKRRRKMAQKEGQR